MGAAASQMERRRISTGRGMENRRIAEQNRLLEETGRKIAGLCLYLKKLNEQKEEEGRRPALADLFDEAINRALRDGKRSDAVDFADGAAFCGKTALNPYRSFRRRHRNCGAGVGVLRGRSNKWKAGCMSGRK